MILEPETWKYLAATIGPGGIGVMAGVWLERRNGKQCKAKDYHGLSQDDRDMLRDVNNSNIEAGHQIESMGSKIDRQTEILIESKTLLAQIARSLERDK
jgi:hypothetical protein